MKVDFNTEGRDLLTIQWLLDFKGWVIEDEDAPIYKKYTKDSKYRLITRPNYYPMILEIRLIEDNSIVFYGNVETREQYKRKVQPKVC